MIEHGSDSALDLPCIRVSSFQYVHRESVLSCKAIAYIPLSNHNHDVSIDDVTSSSTWLLLTSHLCLHTDPVCRFILKVIQSHLFLHISTSLFFLKCLGKMNQGKTWPGSVYLMWIAT
jgi:hypothetical protein